MGTPCTNCIDATTFGQSKECFTIGTDSIIYTGPNLPCSTIENQDTFTEALQKLDAMLCLLGAPQNLQSVLVTGNIATDIGAKFVSTVTPLIYTEILNDQVTSGKFIKIGGLSTEFLMANGDVSTIDDFITQSITDGDVSHAPSSDAVYDALTTIVANVLFDADIPVVLSGGKSLGKYTTGQTIPAIGKTAQQVITDIALEYIYPAFTFFSVTGQATTIETGTTLSGVKPFVWSINPFSGIVPTIDLFDNTAAVFLLSGTPNDGSQSQTITTIQLNADGATQSWKGIANNTSPVSAINSANFVVTARYVRWWAPVAAYPVNPLDGAGNRAYALALSNSAFKNPGANAFVMATGTIQNKFIVLLPPGVTIVSVVDQTNSNTNITPNYILSPITLNDAGGTPRNYNMYQYTNAIPYTVSANHLITTT